MSQYAALAVVSTALDAAIDRTRWHEVCERMSEGFGLHGAALAAGDTINVPEGIGLSGAVMRHWRKLYALMEQGAVDDDSIYQRAISESQANTLLSEWDMLGVSREAPLSHSRIRDFLIQEVGMAERYALKLNTYGPQCDTLIL